MDVVQKNLQEQVGSARLLSEVSGHKVFVVGVAVHSSGGIVCRSASEGITHHQAKMLIDVLKREIEMLEKEIEPSDPGHEATNSSPKQTS